MDKKRYYIDTEGNDDDAYAEAIDFACALAGKEKINRIILLAITKHNVDWLRRIYGDELVKELHKGKQFSDCNALVKIETLQTYKDSYSTNDIVITMALDTKDVNKIEDYYCVKIIIAIPWQKKLLEKWIKSWSPINIRDNEQPQMFEEPPCVVKKALEQLTNSINRTTGINNPHDNNRAKTYIKALHKYDYELDINKIHAYLVRELNWESEHAEDLEKLVKTLQEGRHFQGGEKTGLQNYIKKWKKDCDE